ncbi:MAG: N-acetylglucosamine-6-phosphate deacetylase [Rhodobacter sp.]|nr:N-acetylglucosamine-6-phosphate deacetylase [Rhodobacter sp.]
MAKTAYLADQVFDGAALHRSAALLVANGVSDGIAPPDDVPSGYHRIDLGPGLIAPGFVDLQVNGGGGVMFNDAPSVQTLRRMSAALRRLGTTAFLPTLITDRPETTRAAIEAAAEAISQAVPGVIGLHLEGPHLSLARKGAHDPALIRPMEDGDLAQLCDAAARLPNLMVTVAPEAVTPAQIARLAQSGAVVSLGHSDADFAACLSAAEAGATCVTHLFNAMSQLGNREPGLVGAALDHGSLSAGLIADGIHVHPATTAAALRAKTGPGAIFLVTDAMATAGSDIDGFLLNGRRIERREGRLTLADGTLAGADLDFPQALRVLVSQVGVPLEQALGMCSSGPAAVLPRPGLCGRLRAGARADFVHLDPALTLCGVWGGGAPVPR